MQATALIIFYSIYFVWLFVVTYLSPQVMLLNYFTAAVAAFYVLFVREKGDLIVFALACLVPIIMTAVSFQNWQLEFKFDLVSYMPIWLPLAWGTTAVALRKFYKETVG